MSQLVPQMKEDIPQPSEILQEYWQCSLLVYSCLSLLEFIVSQNTSGWKKSLFGPAHLLKAGATPMIIRLLRDLSSWILNLPKDGVPTACGGGSVPAPSQWQLSSGYPTETALAWLPPALHPGWSPPSRVACATGNGCPQCQGLLWKYGIHHVLCCPHGECWVLMLISLWLISG